MAWFRFRRKVPLLLSGTGPNMREYWAPSGKTYETVYQLQERGVPRSRLPEAYVAVARLHEFTGLVESDGLGSLAGNIGEDVYDLLDWAEKACDLLNLPKLKAVLQDYRPMLEYDVAWFVSSNDPEKDRRHEADLEEIGERFFQVTRSDMNTEEQAKYLGSQVPERYRDWVDGTIGTSRRALPDYTVAMIVWVLSHPELSWVEKEAYPQAVNRLAKKLGGKAKT